MRRLSPFVRLAAVFTVVRLFVRNPGRFRPGVSRGRLQDDHLPQHRPDPGAGRFVDFAVPLQQKHTFYAAAATGGLWKTVNNGQTFEPLFDFEKAFSIGDVAVAPSNPDIL